MIKKIKGKLPSFEKYKQFQRTVPILLANEVKNHFLEGFRKGGGQTDRSLRGWQPRKRSSRRNTGRAILVDTGQLRRDIKKRVVNSHKIVVGTRNVPYGIYHNNGTDRLPQREFIGESQALERKIKKIIETEIIKLK